MKLRKLIFGIALTKRSDSSCPWEVSVRTRRSQPPMAPTSHETPSTSTPMVSSVSERRRNASTIKRRTPTKENSAARGPSLRTAAIMSAKITG